MTQVSHFEASDEEQNGLHSSKEFLTFTLGSEDYGIDIQVVQELRGYEQVTRLANSMDHLKGVINLRDVIVPIVDMRIKFHPEIPPVYDQFTVVIVINLHGQVVGIVVDSVSDVVNLNSADIRPAPEVGNTVESACIVGIGVLEERMLILLDTMALLTSVGLQQTTKLAA